MNALSRNESSLEEDFEIEAADVVYDEVNKKLGTCEADLENQRRELMWVKPRFWSLKRN